MDFHPYFDTLKKAIQKEIIEHEKRFLVENQFNLNLLKQNGLVLHPIKVTRKYFGFAEYPEISFSLPYPQDLSNFKDNSPIDCFVEGEESIKGLLLNLDGNKGELRLFVPDFPDWIEENGVGIKLSFDEHTFNGMKKGLNNILEIPGLKDLFLNIHNNINFSEKIDKKDAIIFQNQELNESQKKAVKNIFHNENICIVHGPPGTGKTTTLVESIQQLIKKGDKIIASAPSNAAIDHITKKLLEKGIKVLRIGNVAKIDDAIFNCTLEGKIINSNENKLIRNLKNKADQYRKMALQYKRNFGKEEREQRNLLLKEVSQIRKEIKKIKDYFFQSEYEKAEVVLGTPIALNDQIPKNIKFEHLIIDEAGQLLEPLAWLIFPFAKKIVLAGDHLQLPPTVLSQEAIKLGLHISILQRVIKKCQNYSFLSTQYRMYQSIAEFSNKFFYDNQLKTEEKLHDFETNVFFIDTVGTGFEEETGEDGFSFFNEGEISIIQQLIQNENIEPNQITFISPYAGQVAYAKKRLNEISKISTIDSFQGQESDVVIISLVRSNQDSNIGFLNEYRRMNVALTRAKKKLFVVGDSSTIGNDIFYKSFLNYVDEKNAYRSAWEYLNFQ